uniref:Retrovirus-related Pol polyprotein from transposon TNT 1-94 n=1 Tax=Cajanus cajan TaxID=3821 RepID=A0A151REW2_CAJCA|nr:Retrovirus-related Pol polyprotein from transposon TNT 1-94 [Cajanus cajan]
MTCMSLYFSSYTPCAGNQKIKLADSSLATVASKGSVTFSPSLTLKNVLHVHNLSYNLVFASKLTLDHNCRINIWSSHCEFQDLSSGKIIRGARQVNGLYLLNNCLFSGRPEQQTCFNSITVFDKDILLWHYRLGHPNVQYLRYLFPMLFMNKNQLSFKCESCELAKHHRAIFPPQPYKTSEPFTMIHSDIWGPSRITTMSGKCWFITFIDDHTRVTWVFLLQEKSDVTLVFKKIYHMILTQFQTQKNFIVIMARNPIQLSCDNKATINIAHNPVLHERTKHVEIDKHFIKEKLEEGVICIPFLEHQVTMLRMIISLHQLEGGCG